MMNLVINKMLTQHVKGDGGENKPLTLDLVFTSGTVMDGIRDARVSSLRKTRDT